MKHFTATVLTIILMASVSLTATTSEECTAQGTVSACDSQINDVERYALGSLIMAIGGTMSGIMLCVGSPHKDFVFVMGEGIAAVGLINNFMTAIFSRLRG